MGDNRDQILEEVVRVIREKCRVTLEIHPDAKLGADLKLDSVGMLTMALELENHYGTNLGEEPDHPPETVNDVVDLLAARLRERYGR